MNTTMNLIPVTINCDAFIVPNHPGTIDLKYSAGQRLAARLERVAEINDFDFDREKDIVVQLWFVNKEISTNFQDHGFYAMYENEEYHFSGTELNYLPTSVFEGHVEGETISIDIPMKPVFKLDPKTDETVRLRDRKMTDFEDDNIEEVPEFIITFNITLKQQGYRYMRFGNFEDVLKSINY